MKIVIPLPEHAEVKDGELIIHFSKLRPFKKWLVDTLVELKWTGQEPVREEEGS